MSLDKKLTQADNVLKRMTAQAEREIIRAYSASLKTIRAQLAEVYAKYDGVDYAVMAKYNRLKALEEEVKAELVRLTKSNARTLQKALGDIYVESYMRTAFAIETESQVKLAYSMLNPKVIEASINNPISGLTLNDRLSKNRLDVIMRIKQEITQGLVNGESYHKMAARAKHALEGDAVKAMRVVQTEAHRVQQDGRLESMTHASDKGIKMLKVWTSSLDSRTRDAHQDLDGQKIAVDADFVSPTGARGPAPGQMGSAEDDINCRCSLRMEIVGYEATVRRARGEGIIPYTTYSEWRANRV